MSNHYAYDLKQYHAYGGGIPQQPNFTTRIIHRPSVTVMDAYDADHNSPLPQQATLQSAKQRAQEIRDKKIQFPAAAEENTYAGVNYNDLPTSRYLCKEAEEMGRDADTYFDDFLTAEFYRGSLRPNKRNPDPTIPKTPAGMKLHVDLLVRAFKSIGSCDDNMGMIKPFAERRHDSKLVECLCWNIVKACIFRSKSDEPLLTAYEPYKARNSLGLDTFDKRFDAIALTLSRSKTICKHLYDAPFLNTFVDDPLKSIRRVDSNRDLNKQKADIMAQGKIALGQPIIKGKKGSAKKRKASATELDDRDSSVGVQTPVPVLHSTGVLPPGGRVTRRMSRMMAEADSSPTVPSSSVPSHIMSSPYSDNVKNESSPLNGHSYNMSAYNTFSGYGMNGTGYDASMLNGITNYAHPSFRYPNPTATSFYPNYAMANPYGNASGLRNPFINMNTARNGGSRVGPRQVEEVSPTTRVSHNTRRL